MTTEATMPVRSAGPRPPLEAAKDSRTTNASRATPAPGRDGARARDAGDDPASRPFAESMTQAMRRTQSKPADETREAEERSANDETTAAGKETASVGDEPAASPAAAPPELQAAAPTVEEPTTAATADEAATIAASMATTGNGTAASALDAHRGPAPEAPATQGDARMEAAASRAAAAAPDAAADASPGDPLQSAAGEAAENVAGDAQPRAPGAEAPQPRSTADFAAQLAQLRGAAATTSPQPADGAGSAPTPAPAGLHRSDVAAPVGDALFASRFAAEVALLGTAGIERAEIRLQPRELGPVRVELSLNGESARIAFSAVHPETRQAIEQSLPILKDMLAERGLTLGETSVSDGQADRGSPDPQASPSQAASDGSAAAAGDDRSFAAGARRSTAIRRTLLDVYA